MVNKLAAAKCFLFDMDGTVYLGNRLLPGAAEFTRYLENAHIPFYFLTNNSSRSRIDYVKKLENLGLPTPLEQILTSGEATARFLQDQNPGARLYLVGTPSLEHEFTRFGFALVDDGPDVVVLGFDTTLTYPKIRKLCDFVRSGIPYIATHPDINCPTEDGYMPDIGSMMAMVSASTGRNPDTIIGKPHQPMVDAVIQKTGFLAEEMVMVGDRLYTDIAFGRFGLTTVLVLSGETKLENIGAGPFSPDFIAHDLADLYTQYLNAQP